MNYLRNMAGALLRWADSHEVSRPLCVATARELMLLAEAELKVDAMSRFANTSIDRSASNDLLSLYDTLRDSSRDIDEIDRSLSVSEGAKGERNVDEVSSITASMAVQKLRRLADVSDQIGDHDLADGIDAILSKI